MRKRLGVLENAFTSSANAALVGAGDPHVFAIFGYGAAGYIDALSLQRVCDLIVGERLAGIFVFDELLHLALEEHERRSGAFGTVDTFGEEESELVDALRRVYVLVRDGAADGGGVHADFLGDLLDHHGTKGVNALFEEVGLTAD